MSICSAERDYQRPLGFGLLYAYTGCRILKSDTFDGFQENTVASINCDFTHALDRVHLAFLRTVLKDTDILILVGECKICAFYILSVFIVLLCPFFLANIK